jgi:hypothetical protein
MRPFLPALVAALAATSISCSRVKLAYEWLDWALEYQAGKYLDLDDVQEAATETAVADYLAWHRRAMLPRHAVLLRNVARAQRSGTFDSAAFRSAWDELSAIYDETMTHMAAPVAELLSSQSREQLAHFEARLAERQAELIEERAENSAAWRQERLEQTYETLEDLVGDLTEQQRREIANRLAAIGASDDIWLAERARRNALLVGALRDSAGAKEVAHFLRGWWLGQLPSPTPEFAEYRQRFNDSMTDILRRLLTSLTSRQRQTFAANLDEYAEAFEELAAEAQPAGTPTSEGDSAQPG